VEAPAATEVPDLEPAPAAMPEPEPVIAPVEPEPTFTEQIAAADDVDQSMDAMFDDMG
jgi:hypothetical protein